MGLNIHVSLLSRFMYGILQAYLWIVVLNIIELSLAKDGIVLNPQPDNSKVTQAMYILNCVYNYYIIAFKPGACQLKVGVPGFL